MANIAALLKQEISRIVRRELKTETEGLKKASTRYRAEIAELKRRIAGLEQKLKATQRQSSQPAAASESLDGESKVRFRAAGLKKHRERLGLSAAALGSILGTSLQTIYNWETGKTRPNKEQVAKIAILRKMGKREVQRRLAQMQAG